MIKEIDNCRVDKSQW